MGVKRRRGEHWKQELAKRPTKRQIAALDALNRGSARAGLGATEETADLLGSRAEDACKTAESAPTNFFDEIADDLARD